MFKHLKPYSVLTTVVWLALLALISGCVSQPSTPEAKKASPSAPVFYPQPPEPPRYQFLTSFKGAEDFKSKAAGMSSFLGSQAQAAGVIKKPFGVVIRQGVISVGDTTTGVFQFDLVKKEFVAFKGSKGLGKIVGPTNISLDKEGNMYVCDSVRKQVLQYDKNDFFIRAFTKEGDWRPTDAGVFDGKLYVTDASRGTGGIKVFDLKSGQLLDTLGLSGPPEQQLGIAASLDFDKDGNLFVMDIHKFMIMRFDRDGHFRGSIGGPGDTPGTFGRPRGLALDRDGRMYAIDAAFDVVQVYTATGQLLTHFGYEKEVPGSLTLPAGVFIDYDNIELFKQYAAPGFNIEYLLLITSQFNRLQSVNVYGYGKMEGAKYKTDTELYQDMLETLEKERANKKP